MSDPARHFFCTKHLPEYIRPFETRLAVFNLSAPWNCQTAFRRDETVNYDMKYHPMNDVLRPHQSAMRKAAHSITRQASTETTESSTIIAESSDSVTTDRPGSASIASPDRPTGPTRT